MKTLHYMLREFQKQFRSGHSYLTELSRSSVINNWIMYQIEGAVVVKKAM